MSKEHIVTWQALIIVFVASACTLVIEIVAGRLLAPYIGVNLYTWTSIIGVVLAGISLGNYAGGWLADRYASRRLLGLQFFASAAATLSILPLLELMVASGGNLRTAFVVRVLIYVAVIFFLPGFVLGTISPVVVKLSLTDLQHSGQTVGLIYAFSTLGSILGTFAAGFWLISAFGTRAIIFGVATVLALMGLLFGGLLRRGVATSAVAVQLIALVAVGALFAEGWMKERYKSPFLRETDYFTINVSEKTFGDGTKGLALVLDHLIHSFSDPTDPTKLEYGYERVYKEVTALKAETHPDMRTAFIGGGGYTYPRYIETVYPKSTVHVVEIDPAVTEVAYERLGVPRDSRIVPYNEDARLFFNRFGDGTATQEPYDIVYGDAFNDIAVPYHLTTAEFGGLVAKALKPDGIYMVNVIDSYQRGEFLKAYMRSLKVHFPHVYLLGLGEAWRSPAASTYVVVGAKQPLDLAALTRVATANGQRPMESGILPAPELDAYLASGRQITLTDDYVPVDQLLAWLFEERGF